MLDGSSVPLDHRSGGGRLQLQLDASTQGATQEIHRLAQDLMQIDRCPAYRRAAGEGEEAARQGPRPFGGSGDAEGIATLLALRQTIGKKLGATENAGQGVVEVVRHPPRQAAERLHLESMPQLALEQSTLPFLVAAQQRGRKHLGGKLELFQLILGPGAWRPAIAEREKARQGLAPQQGKVHQAANPLGTDEVHQHWVPLEGGCIANHQRATGQQPGQRHINALGEIPELVGDGSQAGSGPLDDQAHGPPPRLHQADGGAINPDETSHPTQGRLRRGLDRFFRHLHQPGRDLGAEAFEGPGPQKGRFLTPPLGDIPDHRHQVDIAIRHDDRGAGEGTETGMAITMPHLEFEAGDLAIAPEPLEQPITVAGMRIEIPVDPAATDQLLARPAGEAAKAVVHLEEDPIPGPGHRHGIGTEPEEADEQPLHPRHLAPQPAQADQAPEMPRRQGQDGSDANDPGPVRHAPVMPDWNRNGKSSQGHRRPEEPDTG